jgi:transcription initiation factor TFIIB
VKLLGHSKAALKAAREYVKLRREGQAVLMEETAWKHSVPVRRMKCAYRAIVKTENVSVPVQKPEVWVSRFCDQLNLPEAVRNEATAICQLTSRATCGKSVSISAVAAIYIACRKRNLPFYQRQLSETAGCSEVALRNRYMRMLKVVEQLKGQKEAAF